MTYNTSLAPQTVETIEGYVANQNVQALLSLFQAVISQRDRAERSVDAYLHEIKLLSARFHSMTKPLPDPKTPGPERSAKREAEGNGKIHTPKSKPTTDAIEIDL